MAEPDTLLVIGSAKVGRISGVARGDFEVIESQCSSVHV